MIALGIRNKEPKFSTLKSEEHTAQINKNLAKQIEDRFRAEGQEVRNNRSAREHFLRKNLRIQGINLLSSTTTFEMGYPSGPSEGSIAKRAALKREYVQRVERARGKRQEFGLCHSAAVPT